MSKFLTASDGKIPFLQILIGIIVGAIGMFVYAKFWKPKMLFENENLEIPQPQIAATAAAPVAQQPQRQSTAQQAPKQQQHPQTGNVKLNGVNGGNMRMPIMPDGEAQAYIEIQQIPMPSMPPLATVYETEEYSQDPDDEEIDEDEEEQGYAR